METLLTIALGNATLAAVLAVLAALVGWKARGRRPALVHGLWLLALVKLVTPPLVDVPVRFAEAGNRAEESSLPPRMPAAPAETDAAEADTEGPLFSIMDEPAADISPATAPAIFTSAPLRGEGRGGGLAGLKPWLLAYWPWLIVAAWGVGSAAWLALVVLRIRRFGAVLRSAVAADPATCDRAGVLAGRLGLARSPLVQVVPGRVVPMLWAFGGPPRILLPSSLWKRLDADQRDTLLVHELAHLRRRDHRVRLLELAATCLYWWLPVAWWARKGLRRAEEACCDAWVAWALPDSARAYATALLATVEFLSEAETDANGDPRPQGPPPTPLLASGMGQVHDLSRRMTMILRTETPRGLSWPGRLALLGLAGLLPLLPVKAQPRPTQDGPKLQVEQDRLDALRGQLADDVVAHADAVREDRLAHAQDLLRAIAAERQALADMVAKARDEAKGDVPAQGEADELAKRLARLKQAEDRAAWAGKMQAKGYLSQAQKDANEQDALKAREDVLNYGHRPVPHAQDAQIQADDQRAREYTRLQEQHKRAQDQQDWAQRMLKLGYLNQQTKEKHDQEAQATGEALRRYQQLLAQAGPGNPAKAEGEARPADDEDALRARDEVALAEAQIEIKRAQIEEADAKQTKATLALNRTKKLADQKVVSADEVEAAQGDANAAAAATRAKRGELREAEIRLDQARRQLDLVKSRGQQPAKDALARAENDLAEANQRLDAAKKAVRRSDDPSLVATQRRVDAAAKLVDRLRERAQVQRDQATDIARKEEAERRELVDRQLNSDHARRDEERRQLERREADRRRDHDDQAPIDRRIDDLEKKLDRVLRELEDLRRTPAAPRRPETPRADSRDAKTDWVNLARKLVDSTFDLAAGGDAQFPQQELVAKLYENALGRKPTDQEAKRADELLGKAQEGDITSGDAMNALSQAIAGVKEFRDRQTRQAEAEQRGVTRFAQRSFLDLQDMINALADRKDPAVDIARSIYERVLDRTPTADELTQAARSIDAAGTEKAARRDAINDLVWSLITSDEYRERIVKPESADKPRTSRRIER